MALKILLHTFRMIFGNLGQALRISIGPYLILIALVMILFLAIGGPMQMPMSMSENPADMMINPALGLLPVLFLPVVLFVTSWVAVSWHRFILKEEYAGLLPAVTGRPIWSYAGKAILLGLIIALVAIPLFLVLGLVAAPFVGNGTGGLPFIGVLIFGLASVLLTYLSLRLGVALVGTALAKPMAFREAWSASSNISGVIFSLSVLIMAINIVPGVILGPISMTLPIIGVALELALTWLTMMLGISVLTTLYGHVIENRPLVS